MTQTSLHTLRSAIFAFSSIALCSCGGLSESDKETVEIPSVAAVGEPATEPAVTAASAETPAAAKPVVAAKPAPVMPYSKTGAVKYVVESGDSLSVIAAKNGASMGDVMKVNGIKNANKIRVGQTIFLPAKKVEAADASTPAVETVSTPPTTATDTSGLTLPTLTTGE